MLGETRTSTLPPEALEALPMGLYRVVGAASAARAVRGMELAAVGGGHGAGARPEDEGREAPIVREDEVTGLAVAVVVDCSPDDDEGGAGVSGSGIGAGGQEDACGEDEGPVSEECVVSWLYSTSLLIYAAESFPLDFPSCT